MTVWTTLLALAPCAQGPIELDAPVATHGGTVRTTLALHPDEARTYVDEGGLIAVLDNSNPQTSGWDALKRVPVDASVEALLVDAGSASTTADDRLLIAGGDGGFLVMDVDAAYETGTSTDCQLGQDPSAGHDFPVTRVDDGRRGFPITDRGNVKHCMDVGIVEFSGFNDMIVAVFAEEGANELRVYRRNSLARLNVVELKDGSGAWIPGTAHALAVHDEYCYVAMGTGGVLRVDLGTGGYPVEPGPVLPPMEAGKPDGFGPGGLGWPTSCDTGLGTCPPSQVVDVATGSIGSRHYVYVAGQDWGLGEIALSGATVWDANTTISPAPATAGGAPDPGDPEFSYIRAVDVLPSAAGDRLTVVASGTIMSRWTQHVNFRYDLGLESQDGIDEPADASHLWWYERQGPNFSLVDSQATSVANEQVGWIALQDQGSGDLRLHTMRGTWKLGIHLKYQVLDWPSGGDPTLVGDYRGIAKYMTGGVLTIVDENLLYQSGEGHVGAQELGSLNLAQEGAGEPICLQPLAGTENVGIGATYKLGIMPKAAQWADSSDPNAQWLMHAGDDGFYLKRLRSNLPCTAEIYTMETPKAPGAGIGGQAFSAGRWGSVHGYDHEAAGDFSTTGSPDLVFTSRIQTNEAVRVYSRSRLVALAETARAAGLSCTDLSWPCNNNQTDRHFPCRLYDLQNTTPCPNQPGYSWGGDREDALAPDGLSPGAFAFTLEPHPELDYAIHPSATADPEIDGGNVGPTDPLTAPMLYARIRTGSPVLYFEGDPDADPEDRTWVLAVPAGFDVRQFEANGSPNATYKRAQVALFDLTSEIVLGTVPAATPRPDGLWNAPTSDPAYFPGMALNLDVAKVGPFQDAQQQDYWRDFAFVADVGGRVLVLDVSDHTAPALHATWDPGPSNFDGHYDNVMDLAVDVDDAAGLVYVYAGVHHKGVTRLDYSIDPADGDLTLVAEETDNTFGQGVTGVHLWRSPAGVTPAQRRLLVGDRATRVYGTSPLPVPTGHATCP